VLSSMVREFVTEGHIHRVKVCRGASEISHTFFADDNIFLQDLRLRKVVGNLIDDIHKSLNVYWWGDGVKENPIRWCKRERMCILKFQGGLGFRHLGLFNRSLLAKKAWRLVTSPTTLAARILKARYFPRSSFFDSKIGYRPSYIGRSFLSVKNIVRKGCKWNISNGRSVNVWNEFWVDDHRSLGPKPYKRDVDQVRDLFNLEGDGWNHELLSSLFSHNIASKIACCFVSKSRNYVLYWRNSPGGRFSCRSTYILALKAYEDMNNYLPTIDNLQSRRLNQTSSCTHGGETTENVVHVLFKCSAAKELSGRMGDFYDDIMGTVNEKKQTLSWPVEW
ncbi:hypothetical protein Tco_1013766, partial [Tanacetum coccineum]